MEVTPRIHASVWSFAALRSDGLVVTWGDPAGGGDSSDVYSKFTSVQQLCASADSFAALNRDGTLVSWGGSGIKTKTQVLRVSASSAAFAALLRDGQVAGRIAIDVLSGTVSLDSVLG